MFYTKNILPVLPKYRLFVFRRFVHKIIADLGIGFLLFLPSTNARTQLDAKLKIIVVVREFLVVVTA